MGIPLTSETACLFLRFGVCADDLPSDLVSEAIWDMMAPDFRNVPLWSELTDGGPRSKGEPPRIQTSGLAKRHSEATQRVRKSFLFCFFGFYFVFILCGFLW